MRGRKISKFLKSSSQSTREGILFIGLFLITPGGIGLYKVLHANPTVPISSQITPQNIENGQSPYYSMSISSVKTISTDQDTQTKRITAVVEISNPSESPMQIAPGIQMLLIDTAGVGYPMTAKYLDVGTVVGGQLNPKSTGTYSVDFELPIEASQKTFSFQLDASFKPLQKDI